MLIINADDWGGWRSATDAALACYEAGRISSVTAMVFMADSTRAAEIALDRGMNVGLHLNLNQDLSAPDCPAPVRESHRRVSRFLNRNKYCQLCYNPFLQDDFRATFAAQYGEFQRLYRRAPSHIDGHRHMHLCANMLLGNVIPAGLKVRRSFSFWPGEKSALNRLYREWVDRRLAKSQQITRYFFATSQCLGGPRFDRLVELAQRDPVELMTHPEVPAEMQFLLGPQFGAALARLQVGGYPQLVADRIRA